MLPELWPSGYSPKTLADDVAASAEPLDGPRTAALARAAAAAGAWLAAGSVPERDGADVYNTALLFGREGELRGVHRKAHLYAPLGEDLIFAAGPRLTVCATEDFGAGRPAGLLRRRLPRDRQGAAPGRGQGRRAGQRVRGGGRELVGRAVPGPGPGERPVVGDVESVRPDAVGCAAGRQPGHLAARPRGQPGRRRSTSSPGPAGPALLVAEIALQEELAEADRLNSALWENRREELYTRADAWAGDNT